MPKRDIKETLEALEGIKELGVFIAGRVKDGLDWSDAAECVAKITGDSVFRNKLIAAGMGADKIDDEFKDLDADEIRQIAATGIDIVFAIIKALKKDQA